MTDEATTVALALNQAATVSPEVTPADAGGMGPVERVLEELAVPEATASTDMASEEALREAV